MKLLNVLKKVPPRDVDHPVIFPSEKPWSEIFEEAAVRLSSGASNYLCNAILELRLATGEFSSGQQERMEKYIQDIIGLDGTVWDWVRKHNDSIPVRLDRNEYRAAWARHLAAQFRSKGL